MVYCSCADESIAQEFTEYTGSESKLAVSINEGDTLWVLAFKSISMEKLDNQEIERICHTTSHFKHGWCTTQLPSPATPGETTQRQN